MAQHSEARAAVARRRASGCLSGQIDLPEVASAPFAVHRLARRFGVSHEVAALVAQLAGLGPRETSR